MQRHADFDSDPDIDTNSDTFPVSDFDAEPDRDSNA
jgi:hypothetical protein